MLVAAVWKPWLEKNKTSFGSSFFYLFFALQNDLRKDSKMGCQIELMASWAPSLVCSEKAAVKVGGYKVTWRNHTEVWRGIAHLQLWAGEYKQDFSFFLLVLFLFVSLAEMWVTVLLRHKPWHETSNRAGVGVCLCVCALPPDEGVFECDVRCSGTQGDQQ